METNQRPPHAAAEHLAAAEAFAALGSEARLDIVRQLVRAEPEGLSVGALQARVGLAASTLSHHLRALTQCGLITQAREGRSLICRADVSRIEALAAFLTRECCVEFSSDGDNEKADAPLTRPGVGA